MLTNNFFLKKRIMGNTGTKGASGSFLLKLMLAAILFISLVTYVVSRNGDALIN